MAGIDFQQLLASDPTLQAALRALTAKGTAQQGALSTARQQALIGYGAVPDQLANPDLASLLGGVAPDITDSTRELARDATDSGLSTTAQLAHAYQTKQAGDVANLGGRGMLRSGAYGQHSRENLLGYQTGEANAQQQLLSNLAGLWQGYQGEQDQNAATAQGATSDALGRIVAQINAGLLGGGTSGGQTGTSPAAAPGGEPKNQAPFTTPVGAPSATVPKPTAANYGTVPARRAPLASAFSRPRPLY